MVNTPITRREALKQSAVLLATVCTTPGFGFGAEPAKQRAADWPVANGPDGNFNPRRYGHALVDDLAKARLLWKSEDNDIGFAKGSASGYLALLVKRPAHPGSCSGPIVAEGKVFCTSFRPAGQVWAENLPHLKNLKQPYEGKDLEKLKKELRIDADDLVLAVNQRTGKTAWKAVEPGKGLNRYMGKREGFDVAPAYFQGSPDGKEIVSGDGESGLTVWDAQSGEELLTLEGHDATVTSVAYSPDGRCIVSGSQDDQREQRHLLRRLSHSP